MNTLFISDNIYLCEGIFDIKVATCLASDFLKDPHKNITKLKQDDRVVIAVSDATLRWHISEAIKNDKHSHIFMMKYMDPDSYAKFNDVIYISSHFTMRRLKYVIHHAEDIRNMYLTTREHEMLLNSSLINFVISKMMSVSEKTCSSYRISLKSKLNMKCRNNIAMEYFRRQLITQSLPRN
ncbi:hypothetical protein WH357_21215 [Enterobacter ludwigii]